MKTSALLLASALSAVVGFGMPVIQVRDIPHSPTVSVVAWDAGNADVGLRTQIRRDGSGIGEARVGEHRLYLSSVLVDARGGFAHAVAHDGKLLRNTNKASDRDACRFGNVCLPRETVGVGVSDEWLRQHRDSVIVTLRPRTGQNWTIRLEGALIDSYLRTVDSVSAAMKKP
jgi:hypothetical protein